MAKYRARRALPPGLVRVSSSKIANTQLHARHVAFARLVSCAPTDGDFDSHCMHMPRHARGANSTARSRPHAAVAPR